MGKNITCFLEMQYLEYRKECAIGVSLVNPFFFGVTRERGQRKTQYVRGRGEGVFFLAGRKHQQSLAYHKSQPQTRFACDSYLGGTISINIYHFIQKEECILLLFFNTRISVLYL